MDKLKMYDKLPAEQAVLQAWSVPGNSPRYHEYKKAQVRKDMPLLARALDRLEKDSKH